MTRTPNPRDVRATVVLRADEMAALDALVRRVAAGASGRVTRSSVLRDLVLPHLAAARVNP